MQLLLFGFARQYTPYISHTFWKCVIILLQAFSDTCVDAPSASMIAEDRFTPTPSSADSGRGLNNIKLFLSLKL